MIVPAGTFGAVWPICALAPVPQQAASASTTTIRFIIVILQFISESPRQKATESRQAYQIHPSNGISPLFIRHKYRQLSKRKLFKPFTRLLI
jgi:hypothetical protein